MKSVLENITSKLRSIDKKLVIYAAIFALTVFAQCVLYQWRMTGTIIISSLWCNTLEFMAYYMPKFGMALFFGAMALLFKRKYWTLYASVLIDVWMYVELIYYRAFGFVLESSTMLIATNMKGFEDSIFMFLNTPDLVLIVPTLILAVSIFFFNTKETNWVYTILVVVFAYILEICGMLSFHAVYRSDKGKMGTEFDKYSAYTIPDDELHFNPFSNRAFYSAYDVSDIQKSGEKYIRYHSAIHHFIYNVKEICSAFINGRALYKMSDEDIAKVREYCLNEPQEVVPNSKLILVLVESFENWVVRPDVMPNLCKFIDSHESIFWATKIKRQIKAGSSADGQMIVNTGLLPIKEGPTCFLYTDVVYPSLSACYTPPRVCN